MAISIPPEIQASNAGNRLLALIALVEGRRELSEEEFAGSFGALTPPTARERFNVAMRRAVLSKPEERIVRIECGPTGDDHASAYLTLDSGDRLGVLTRGRGEGPQGFTASLIERIAKGVTVRAATDDDAAALREIERVTPMDFTGGALKYDKGEDYFAQDRLKDDATTFVIEIDSQPAGLFKIARRRLTITGQPKSLVYAHRHRVAPWAQRRGLHHVVNFITQLETLPAASRYDLIRSDHRLAQNMVPTSSWSVSPERLLIDTRDLGTGAADVGRKASASDAAALVDLLNDTHGAKELFVPYTRDSLAWRLSQLPGAYTWANVRLGQAAALGTWLAGWTVSRVAEGRETRERRAIVLDYGVRAGAEAELIQLIRATSSALVALGITEISLFTTPADRAREELLKIAKAIEPYRLMMPFPEPPDLSGRGVYLDQVYL